MSLVHPLYTHVKSSKSRSPERRGLIPLHNAKLWLSDTNLPDALEVNIYAHYQWEVTLISHAVLPTDWQISIEWQDANGDSHVINGRIKKIELGQRRGDAPSQLFISRFERMGADTAGVQKAAFTPSLLPHTRGHAPIPNRGS